MTIRNLTPHSIDFYAPEQFIGLEQRNPTTWVADGVEGKPILSVSSEGMLRVATTTIAIADIEGLPAVATEYGGMTGVPDDVQEDDTLVVSLPALMMAQSVGHSLAKQMFCPYKVVRSRENGSLVFGAMGLSK